MIDVKKLVVGFLVLAAATGSSAFIISTTSTLSANNASPPPSSPVAAPLLSGNAFVAQPAVPDMSDVGVAGLTDPTLTSSTETQATDPNNLTEVLAGSFLNNLVSANPAGVQTGPDGNTMLIAPDNGAIIAQLTKNDAFKKLPIPNWDIEAAEQPIMIETSSSPNALASYSDAVKNIFNQYFVETNLQSMLDQNADPNAAGYVHDQIQSALQNVGGLKVPAAAADFQKSIVKLLVYEKNLAELVRSASGDDPLKAVLVFQTQREKYSATLQDFKNELQKNPAGQIFSSNGDSRQERSGVAVFLRNFVGIKTANAQWLTFDASNFAQMLLDYANNIILQILKNLIMKLMQNTVLKWISGKGVPRFIQNWGRTLVNSYTTAAVNAIDQQMACINPSLAPRLSVLFQVPSFNNGGGGFCAIQFQNQLAGNKLTQFYNSFEQGGVDSYLKLFQPGGNDFGILIDIQDQAMAAGGNSKNATQAKSAANQGWTGNEQCADGSDPNGVHNHCIDSKGVGSYTNPDGTCDPGLFSEEVGNGGKCANGEDPLTTSPGQVTGQVFNSTVKGGPELVTAANDIVGLLNAFLTSLLNSLASAAINSLK